MDNNIRDELIKDTAAYSHKLWCENEYKDYYNRLISINDKDIIVFGDGSIVRDYIYISDAVKGITNIAFKETGEYLYNLGSGTGTSLNELLLLIKETLHVNPKIYYRKKRKVDLPVNYLDITRYNHDFGYLDCIPLREGIKKTANFLKGGRV